MTSDKPRRSSDVWVSQDSIDEVLRELRRRRQVTQKQIADEAQVSPAAIARLEKGDRRPSRSMLSRLAAVYGTTSEGIVEAARRVAAGEEPDTVLDGLPAAVAGDVPVGTAANPALAREAAWQAPDDVLPPTAPSASQLQASSRLPHVDPQLLELAAQLQALRNPDTAIAVARQLEALDDPDAATSSLLRHAIGVARQLEGFDEQDTAAELLHDALDWLVENLGSHADIDRLRRELLEVRKDPVKGREPVVAMPTGEVRYIFRTGIGTDEHGQVWIDPFTRARSVGYDSADPRVERYDTGQVVVDTSRLDDPDLGPRDPERHRLKATVPRPHSSDHDPDHDPAPGSLEQLYTRIRIELHWPDAPVQTLTPGPEATESICLPDAITQLHIITAHNPRSRLLRPSENEERNRLLHDELTRAGLLAITATTRSMDGSWREDGFAVLDAETDTVVELARRYEQTAILQVDAGGIHVLWVDRAVRA